MYEIDTMNGIVCVGGTYYKHGLMRLGGFRRRRRESPGRGKDLRLRR